MLGLIKKLAKNKKGAAGIEYGFLAALIAVAAVVSMQALGVSVNSLYGGVAGITDGAGDGAGDGGSGGGKGGKGKGGKGKGGKGKGGKGGKDKGKGKG